MKRKRMAIAAAFVAAGLVLLVTLLAGPEKAEQRDELTKDQVDALHLDTQFNAGNAGGDSRFDSPDLSMPHETDQGELLFTDPENDRVTRLFWQHMTPQSRFVYDMDEPMVRIIFSPSRILEVTGDKGHFEINDQENQIRRGTLAGNVTVRLLETSDGSDVDLHTDRDEQLRMTLGDAAEFDMELGQLTSDSAIHVTGPRVEFTGFGLLLSYNSLRDRIDRLIIDRDVSLRLRRQPLAASRDDTTSKPEPTTEPAPVKEGEKKEKKTKQQPTDDLKPPQFYLAHFEKNVVVVADQRQTRMTADSLDATFTFDGGNDDRPAAPAPVKHAEPKEPRPQREPVVETTVTEATTEEPPADESDGEVFVTCDGRLFMEPITEPEPDLAADPRAVLLALVGTTSPAQVSTGDGEFVTGQRIDYLTTTGRVRAFAGASGGTSGGDAMPMLVRSTELGELTGRALSIDPTAATGYVTGPGSLTTSSTDDPDKPSLHTTWNDRLDLSFFTRPRRNGPAELLAVRTATFRGDARIEHPDFQMTADTLTATAERVNQREQRLTAIDAEGAARITALRTDDDQPMSIATDKLHVDVTTDEHGKQQPARLLADGHVEAQQPGNTLRTQYLDATLGPVVENAGDQPKLSVTAMTATGGVEVVSADPAAHLHGDRMTVDGLTRQMELYGVEGGDDARILRDDAELVGPRLVMSQADQTVHVIGPGTFTFINTPVDAAGDAAGDATTVAVAWRDSMHFDQVNGYAQFLGDVNSTARTASDFTLLTCEDLRMDFDKLTAEETKDVNSDAPLDRVRIRTATALGSPIFSSRSFDPAAPDLDLTKFRLEGPIMTFENRPDYELVQVNGPGRMLIEDYRNTTDSKPETQNAKPVSVSGKGQTLFTWQKQLTLDAARNDMLMEQQVQMVHRPVGDKPGTFGAVATMSCDKLFADLSESQGMDGWLSDSSPKPNINMIVADRNVTIVQTSRTALCDRLWYFGKDNTIKLQSAEGKRVQVKDPAQPAPLAGRVIEWRLDTDTFVVDRPGALTVPIRQ